jgi:hypothetical protein
VRSTGSWKRNVTCAGAVATTEPAAGVMLINTACADAAGAPTSNKAKAMPPTMRVLIRPSGANERQSL